MKEVKTLYKQLQARHFETKYPNYAVEDHKIHVLYVTTCINESGWYRVIAPFFKFNTSDTHVAIIANMHKWDFNKSFNEYDNPVDERLITWADFVVLPALFSGVDYILQAFRQVNKHLRFVMDLRSNYDLIPKDHPLHKKINQKMKEQLLDNLSKMDHITSVSGRIIDHYDSALLDRFPQSTVLLDYLPHVSAPQAYAGLTSSVKKETKSFSMGVFTTGPDGLRLILDALRKVKHKYGDHIALLFFGWDGQFESGDRLEGLDATFQKSVSFLKYFETLNSLQLDLALLPLAKTSLNDTMKLHELAALGIPVIASASSPYEAAIKHKHNGYLAQREAQWISAITALLSDAALRQRISMNAQTAVMKLDASTSAGMEHHLNLFR